MILPDSSAWIELLRRTDSAVHRRLHNALEADEAVVITEPVVMEVLAGATSRLHAKQLRTQLVGFPLASVGGLAGFEEAAALYRACRDAGEQLRRTTDCLIAMAALRADASVLHLDRDFDTIARHSDLRIEATS
ncbi:MAG: PIN domain nuclease [Actinomycetota bacterium]